jgi:hypothetical protein
VLDELEDSNAENDWERWDLLAAFVVRPLPGPGVGGMLGNEKRLSSSSERFIVWPSRNRFYLQAIAAVTPGALLRHLTLQNAVLQSESTKDFYSECSHSRQVTCLSVHNAIAVFVQCSHSLC